GFFDRVGHADQAGQRAVDGEKDDGLAFLAQRLGTRSERPKLQAVRCQQSDVSQHHPVAFDDPGDALAGDGLELLDPGRPHAAFLISTPAWAPRPVPTMIDIGVARPRAHGQAMMRTATALTTAYAKRGSGPKNPHPSDVTTAMSTTAGTNQDETTSARRWMGARLR